METVCTKYTNGTCIDEQVKTKDGTVYTLKACEHTTVTTTKENPFTHFRFLMTGKERFKPIVMDKIRDYSSWIV
jgi:hypothetical protein